MIERQFQWLLKSLSLRGSVFGVVLPRALVFGALAIGVNFLYQAQPELPWDFCQYLMENVALNLILGLLLVFRTNTAYERFWEGRKAWDEIIANICNLLRELHAAELLQPENSKPRSVMMGWLVALAIATKSHLRQDFQVEQFEQVLAIAEFEKITKSAHAPMLILQWLNISAQKQLSIPEKISIQEKFAALTNGITTCERIFNTPLPFAYTIFLRKFILLYCFFLPFGLVETLLWGTIPITLLVAFVLFGVEAIAEEIEDPFGKDENDLPLEELCQMITKEAREFEAFQDEHKVISL
ncbi:hypothetical protein Lepto7376_0168 [[Leptolyngbya] sp. PCC 7376]|uniref:bestrophin family protein n=1 Tax=[Leptolyngbya] sp. PCC 7376 TaxID=111781 RepID=UPI00029F4661|nr:bestrophin family ion channel [[Leptolyngbya] sp. PCC 7376]AFY36613.1 hypothetical protein Lepto7376_0168 [[Leptolyngbya] sp. PCC 7376]